MSPDELHAIMAVAVQAISTCNTQPWRVRLRDGVLSVFMIRTKNFFLKLEGNTWLELGTFLENLSVGAASKGYRADVALFETSGVEEPAARVTFVKEAVPAVNIDAVMRRCTNRGRYSAEPLSAEVQQSILAANDDSPNVDVSILTRSKKDTCLRILHDLERLSMGNWLLVREVMPYVRTDLADIEAHRDRLDIRTLELGPFAVRLAALSKRYPTFFGWFIAFFSLFVAGQVQRRLARTWAESGALLVFSIRDRSQHSYVSLGRVVQRILNSLTAQNVQTFTVVNGLYLFELLKENLEIYSNSDQRALLRYQYELQSFLGFGDRRLALFVRAGYGEAPAVRARRRPVKSFFIDDLGNEVRV